MPPAPLQQDEIVPVYNFESLAGGVGANPKGSAHVLCAWKSLLTAGPGAQVTAHFVPIR